MQKCSTALNWFLNTKKVYFVQLHCEKAPWNTQLYNKCSPLTSWVKSQDSWGGGISQRLLHTTSHMQPRLPDAHLHNFGDGLVLTWALSLQGGSEDQKDFTKTHKVLVELGGNSHPQAQPSHVTSPCEEAQAPRTSRRDHLASSSPVPHRGSSLHPLQLCLPQARVHAAGWKTTSQPWARLQLVFLFPLVEISAGSIPLSFRPGLCKLKGEGRNEQVRDAALHLLAPILANVSLRI